MSLKTILLQQVINGFAQSGILTRLVDDDIELLLRVAQYAEKRVETALGLGDASQGIKGDISGNDPQPAGILSASQSGTLSTAQPASEQHSETEDDQAKLPLGNMDRGPEPQTVAQTLSTVAPAEAEIDPDLTDPPPDYTKLLSTTKG